MINKRVKFKYVATYGIEILSGTILDKVRIENYYEGRTNIDAYVVAEADTGEIHIVKPQNILEIL